MNDGPKSECTKLRRGGIALRHLLRLLRINTSGNVLIITALCLVPLLMLIGSAVDISRATMAKSRLQNACDAASLAARRVMRNDTFDNAVSQTGRQFFAFNFPQRSFDTDAFTPQITRPSAGVVRVEASTRIHKQIMNIFGFDTIALQVNCDASLNFVNTDVVLVLDVTGSMADAVGGTAKIAALRNAVMALYDELAPIQQQLEAQGLRLRYGIVPYSSSVNVGRLLYAANPANLTSTTNYQSRVANYNSAVYTANAPTAAGAWEYYNGSSGAGSSSPTTFTRSTSQCQTWVQAASTSGGGPAPTATTVTSYGGSSTSSSYDSGQDWG
jgi:Flp pilus assembly protein TadG